MAFAAVTTIINDGPKVFTIRCTGYFDGATGEETAAIKVNVSDLDGIAALTKVKIQRVWYTNTVPGTIIEFAGDTPHLAFPLPLGSDYMDFRSVGGLTNTVTDVPTGDITLTTVDGAAAGQGYAITFEVSR